MGLFKKTKVTKANDPISDSEVTTSSKIIDDSPAVSAPQNNINKQK